MNNISISFETKSEEEVKERFGNSLYHSDFNI